MPTLFVDEEVDTNHTMTEQTQNETTRRLGRLSDSLSKVPLHLTLAFGTTELAIGTGFIYEVDGNLFLITARHNVTGRHNETGKPLHSMGALPDNLIVRVWDKAKFGRWTPVTIALYDQVGLPFWYEHPTFSQDVDAVALPITLPAGLTTYPVNQQDFDLIPLSPGLDVFVLGFPLGISGGGRLPIWKRGSIATEPDIDLDNLPKLLIDTATRQGLSGAPVVTQIIGYWLPEGVTDENQAVFGGGRRFLGIYSGRVGDDEFKAQLGIVWKHNAILDIIRGKRRAAHL